MGTPSERRKKKENETEGSSRCHLRGQVLTAGFFLGCMTARLLQEAAPHYGVLPEFLTDGIQGCVQLLLLLVFGLLLQIEDRELAGSGCRHKLCGADAEKPYGASVPEGVKQAAGEPVNVLAGGGRRLCGHLVGYARKRTVFDLHTHCRQSCRLFVTAGRRSRQA